MVEIKPDIQTVKNIIADSIITLFIDIVFIFEGMIKHLFNFHAVNITLIILLNIIIFCIGLYCIKRNLAPIYITDNVLQIGKNSKPYQLEDLRFKNVEDGIEIYDSNYKLISKLYKNYHNFKLASLKLGSSGYFF